MPRDIHTRAKALFGSELPCQEDGDCEYSEGWDRASDPETQADLLIRSYGHAHVESARTTYSRDERGRIDRGERAVVLNEFIGDAYTEDFGSEFLHHAVWLASALHDEVNDRQNILYEADLWGDEGVVAAVDISANNLAAVVTSEGDHVVFHGRPCFERFHDLTIDIADL